MTGSPVDALSKAVERSKQLLFPFKAEKWFALGFTVFMAQCAEGGGGGSSFNMPSLPSPPSSSGGSSSPGVDFQKMFDEAARALGAELNLYITLAAIGFVVLFGFGLFILWFSSRAKLMFVESVIHDRVDLSSQWSRAAELGMSLFKGRLALGLIVWVVGLGSIAAAVVVGLPDFRTGDFAGTRALIAYAIFAATGLFIGLPLGIAQALLEDFVVPLMVVRNARVLEAWRIFRTEALPGNVGGVIVFYLLRIVLAIGIAIAIMTISCLTCCIAALPYLGTVILLPIWVFNRAYPIHYLEQLGIQVFPQPEPSWAAYDQWRFPR